MNSISQTAIGRLKRVYKIDTVYTMILFQDASISYTNGHSGKNRQVEITLAGRARSREDLCPDRPKSRFEHAV